MIAIFVLANSISDCVCANMTVLSHVQLFAAPWIVAHQSPLSMEFSRKEYWNRLPFPFQGIWVETEPAPPVPFALHKNSLLLSHQSIFFSGLILRLNTQISFLPFYLQKLLNRARFSLSEIEISVLKTVMMKIHIKIWTLSLEQDIEMLLSSSWWWNHLNLECDSFLGDLFDYYKIDIYTQTPISSWKGT